MSYLNRLLRLATLAILCAFTLSMEAAPQHIVMMIGEDEYQTWDTLPLFAREVLEPAGYRVTLIHADRADKNNFPGLIAALKNADLLLVSVRRRTPIKEQLDAVRAYLAAGKPLVGIRTACHAFSPLPKETVTDPRLDAWTKFDPEVLGGNYTGHHRGEGRTTVALVPGREKHPILQGIAAEKISTPTILYKVSPLAATTTPLLTGTFPGQPSEPIAWTHEFGPRHARVFFTSLGGPADMSNPEFRRLLANGVRWALTR